MSHAGANQWPSIQPQRAEDWADELALAICADVRARRHTDATGLIAARLRLLKVEGEAEGLRKAAEAFASPAPSPAVLQREYQRDVEENGHDGWGP